MSSQRQVSASPYFCVAVLPEAAGSVEAIKSHNDYGCNHQVSRITARSVAVVVLSITLYTHENNNINIYYIIIQMRKKGFEKNATTATV